MEPATPSSDLEPRLSPPAEDFEPEHPEASPKPETGGNKRRRSRIITLRLLIASAALALGIPWIRHSLHTVSTDDAYVDSYVTFVAPRIAGQVARVLVEDNNRVKKGDVLVELDSEPYRLKLAISEAALETAKADSAVVQANTLGLLAQARSARFKLAHAIEDVDNQVAIIKQGQPATRQIAVRPGCKACQDRRGQ